MNPINVKYKILCAILFLALTVISLQIYVAREYVLRNIIGEVSHIVVDSIRYEIKSPTPTLTELTIAALRKDLEKKRSSSPKLLFESFLFSYYPHPRFNLTSSFLSPKKTSLKKSELADRLARLYSLLNDTRQVCSKKALIGGWSCEKRLDGAKPVCMSLIPNKNCLVYSFGVGHDFSFEINMANYGCHVFTFDDDDTHTYDNTIIENLYFFKVRLGPIVKLLDVFNKATTKNYRFLYRPLDNIMYILQHENLHLDLLKIDIEGDEWEVLNESLCKSGILNRTRQLVLETHLDVLLNFTNVQEEHLLSNISYYNKAFQCLINHKFVLSMSTQNEIRPTFSVIEGVTFMVNEEQLWINTNFNTTGSEIKDEQSYIFEDLEKLSLEMEKRNL